MTQGKRSKRHSSASGWVTRILYYFKRGQVDLVPTGLGKVARGLRSLREAARRREIFLI